MKATVFDYGAGNLHSLERALVALGLSVRREDNLSRALGDTQLLVLPGVGAFGLAARQLAPWREEAVAALRAGLPCVGICLGMQLLFEGSEEASPEARGLGWFSGSVTRLTEGRIPHIGWTPVQRAESGSLPLPESPYMYFAHSYACQPADARQVEAWAVTGGQRFPAVVRSGRVVGVQFHPEKSSSPGVQWLGQMIGEVTA